MLLIQAEARKKRERTAVVVKAIPIHLRAGNRKLARERPARRSVVHRGYASSRRRVGEAVTGRRRRLRARWKGERMRRGKGAMRAGEAVGRGAKGVAPALGRLKRTRAPRTARSAEAR